MDRPKPKHEDNRLFLFRGPGYYDSPEGQAPWEKIWGLTKYGIGATIGMTMLDGMFYSEPKNLTEVARNAGYWAVPIIGMSFAFSSVTYISANFRGKDDKLNYLLGALSCSPILHAWRNSISFTLHGTAVLVAAALLKKDSKEKGYGFYGWPEHRQYAHYKIPSRSLVGEWPKRPI